MKNTQTILIISVIIIAGICALYLTSYSKPRNSMYQAEIDANKYQAAEQEQPTCAGPAFDTGPDTDRIAEEMRPEVEKVLLNATPDDGYDPYEFYDVTSPGNLNTDGKWAFISALSHKNPAVQGDFHIKFVVAEKKTDGKWYAALQGTKEYKDLINKMPDCFLDKKTREFFRDHP